VLVAVWFRRQADWTLLESAVADLGDELRLDGLHVLSGAMLDVEFLPNADLLRLDPQPTERRESLPPRSATVIRYVDPARPHLVDAR
jgi:hypothetical protein